MLLVTMEVLTVLRGQSMAVINLLRRVSQWHFLLLTAVTDLDINKTKQ
jgi:hypothetical protein